MLTTIKGAEVIGNIQHIGTIIRPRREEFSSVGVETSALSQGCLLQTNSHSADSQDRPNQDQNHLLAAPRASNHPRRNSASKRALLLTCNYVCGTNGTTQSH